MTSFEVAGNYREDQYLLIRFTNGYTVPIPLKDGGTVKPDAWTPASSTFHMPEMDPEMLVGWMYEVSRNPPIKQEN